MRMTSDWQADVYGMIGIARTPDEKMLSGGFEKVPAASELALV